MMEHRQSLLEPELLYVIVVVDAMLGAVVRLARTYRITTQLMGKYIASIPSDRILTRSYKRGSYTFVVR